MKNPKNKANYDKIPMEGGKKTDKTKYIWQHNIQENSTQKVLIDKFSLEKFPNILDIQFVSEKSTMTK